MPQKNLSFPFHVTQSEQRILRDLLGVGAARESRLVDQGFANEFMMRLGSLAVAAEAIAGLQKMLFPQEARLREQRAKLLLPLQSRASRAHYDQTLESDEIGMTVNIRNAEDFVAFKTAITHFDYAAWQQHCEGERVDAD